MSQKRVLQGLLDFPSISISFQPHTWFNTALCQFLINKENLKSFSVTFFAAMCVKEAFAQPNDDDCHFPNKGEMDFVLCLKGIWAL